MQQTHLFTSTRSTQYKLAIRLEKGLSPLLISIANIVWKLYNLVNTSNMKCMELCKKKKVLKNNVTKKTTLFKHAIYCKHCFDVIDIAKVNYHLICAIHTM